MAIGGISKIRNIYIDYCRHMRFEMHMKTELQTDSHVFEVKVRYISPYMAKLFGSDKDIETIRLTDKSATYRNLLDLLKNKYDGTFELKYGRKPKEGSPESFEDAFIILQGGRAIQVIKDRNIDSEKEVLVAGNVASGG